MLAGCKPVWDVSRSSFTLRTHPGSSMKLDCCGRPKLKIKLPRALPGIIHEEVNISRHGCCGWRGGKELGQANQQQQGRRCLVTCSATCGIRRRPSLPHPPILHLTRTVSLLALESRPGSTVSRVASSSSLAVTLTAIAIRKDVELLGLTKSDTRMQLRPPSLEQDRNVADCETVRRRKIAIANKGRVPWNKGGKHSPETIKLIKEKTTQAMSCPLVKAKLRQNARHPQSDETRAKIKSKLRVRWDLKKKVRGYQEIMLKEWRRCVADAARKGGLWEEEMAWNSYDAIKQQMRVDAGLAARAERSKKREQEKQARGHGKSEEHRQKIADAIKAKWSDPEYQNKVREGMAKTGRIPRPRKSPSSRPTRKRVATSTAGAVKVPTSLDHGFVNAVMSGEKNKVNRQKRPAIDQDDGDLSDSEADATSIVRNRKVDLLRIVTDQSIDKSSKKGKEYGSIEESSVSSGGSGMGVPLASEMFFPKLQLWASRSVLDYKRKEATQRAKLLMAEAEKAVKDFEAGAERNDDSVECLAEIRRLMAEATQFIQTADSLDRAVDDTESQREYSRGVSTMSSTNQSKLTRIQIKPPGVDESTSARRSEVDNEPIMSSPEYDANHTESRYAQPGQEDSTLGITSKASTSSGATDIMRFGSQAREVGLVRDGHGLYTGESAQSAAAAAKNRVPSSIGLLDGRKSRKVGAGEDRESTKTLFERRHKAGILPLDDERLLG